MTTRLFSKGQVVLPAALRRKLALKAGDLLDITIEDGPKGMRIVMAPRVKKAGKWKIIKDPITGWPVLKGPAGTPKLTSERAKELLTNFP